jgi:hypothetical protein
MLLNMPRCLFMLLPLLAFSQRPDPGPSPRPNPTRDATLAEIMPVTTGVLEDDHPAIASRNGTAWVVWLSYSEADHSTQIQARSYTAGKWSEAVRVTEAAGDYNKPGVTIDDTGVVWVVWPAQVRDNWDLYARRRNPNGSWSAIERLTFDNAPDINPQLAAAGGRVMLVWQSMRRAQNDILHRIWEKGRWSAEAPVADSPANDWEPVVAATPDGAFHVAWDSYRGDYDVLIRSWREGKWSPEMALAVTSKLENHAMLTADVQNRVWITWEIGPENWAADSADGGLRPRRDLGLACLENGRLHSLPNPPASKEGFQAGVLIAATDGGVRLFGRQPMNRNWLSVYATAWSGGKWLDWEPLHYSEGRIDQRVVAADVGAGRILLVYPAGSSHNIIYAKAYSGLKGEAPALTPIASQSLKSAAASPQKHTFRGHTLVWGDLHRHTDISEDGGIPDGSLTDAMRYSLDAGGLDFVGITDHTRYLPRRYNLYRIQQINDLYYRSGAFSPLHAYERSQYSPWGHRNVVHQERNFTPVPASYDLGDPGVSPWGLFEALRGRKAMSIPHTSAWGNKQVSWDYWDPQVERLVEMYQGLRSTYEYNGAPDPADRAIYEKDSKNFVWDALARGRKLGFIASSDHRSTHMSFAAVYVKGIDRESIFEGLHARRTYASTDKILLEVSIGEALMGEEARVEGAPELQVAVTGTGPIARVEVVRNQAFVYSTQPKTNETKFTFRDQKFDGTESYYYVRVIQENKQMAWSSPIWVRR